MCIPSKFGSFDVVLFQYSVSINIDIMEELEIATSVSYTAVHFNVRVSFRLNVVIGDFLLKVSNVVKVVSTASLSMTYADTFDEKLNTTPEKI